MPFCLVLLARLAPRHPNSYTEAESREENASHCQGEERQGQFKLSGRLQIRGTEQDALREMIGVTVEPLSVIQGAA